MDRRTFLSLSAAVIALGFVVSVTLFKVVDSDVWWHIRAGQVMWETKGWIFTDPFAWTRAGEAYIATHEWLTQFLFAAAYGLGGDAGIIGLRILCALLVFGLLLSIDRRNLWPNALLVMGAGVVMRQGFVERPQMLSNVFFAGMLVVGLKLLDGWSDGRRPEILLPGKKRESFLLSIMIVLQILWVNLHGAAAILSLPILGAVFLEELLGRRRWKVLRLCVLAEIGLLLALFLSPNLHHNLTYAWLLFSDRTASFIKEWSPHPWPQYLVQLGPFWLIALAALTLTRRRWIATSLLLLATGILSRLGARHEGLFILTALGVTFFELQKNERWLSLLAGLRARLVLAITLSIAVIAGILWIDASYRDFVYRSNLGGIGHFAPAEGAADFLARNHITGKIFNTYVIGGYLLFRGFPVFLDGRNVDYGYRYIQEALDARGSAAAWRDLERRYDFTVAVLESGWTNRGTPEFTYLRNDPTWALVYVDDWTAVYLKENAVHRAVIDASRYALLTPENLRTESLLAEIPREQWPTLQQELLRAIAQDPSGIDALLRLGQIAATAGEFDPALVALQEAMRRAPGRYEPFALAAAVHAAKREWREAAALYEAAIERTRYLPVELNDAKVADVYEQLGESTTAEKYRRKVRSY